MTLKIVKDIRVRLFRTESGGIYGDVSQLLKLLVKDEIISCDLGNLGNLQCMIWWSFMNGRIQTWQWIFLLYIDELKNAQTLF